MNRVRNKSVMLEEQNHSFVIPSSSLKKYGCYKASYASIKCIEHYYKKYIDYNLQVFDISIYKNMSFLEPLSSRLKLNDL